MRVTSYMIYEEVKRNMQRELSRVSSLQDQIASAKRIGKPSDDVLGNSRAMDYKVVLNNNDQYIRNIDNVSSQLDYTDNVLQGLNNTFGRAKELALAGVNGEQTAATRIMIANEVRTLRDSLLGVANTRFGDRYIFSGYLTNKQAYSLNAGGEYTYQGDTNNLLVNVVQNTSVKVNVTGDVAFNDPAKLISAVLGSTVGTGTLQITSGTGNAIAVPVDAANNSPEAIRDTINGPMSKWYNAADSIGTGTLTLKAGLGDPVTLAVDPANLNDTPTLLRDAINALAMGIEARVITDSVTSQERLVFRPVTVGDAISIDVSGDIDGNNTDANGLSALLHNATTSNLTTNALGIESQVINGTAGKRMLFRPVVSGTSFIIDTIDDDGNNTDAAGLSNIYHNPPAGTNLTSAVSYFTTFDHLINSLVNNDTAGINASIFLLDGATDQNLNILAELGSRSAFLTAERQSNEDRTLNTRTNLSQTEDADMITTSSDLVKTQTSLQALMQSSSRIMAQSLFDFLK